MVGFVVILLGNQFQRFDQDQICIVLNAKQVIKSTWKFWTNTLSQPGCWVVTNREQLLTVFVESWKTFAGASAICANPQVMSTIFPLPPYSLDTTLFQTCVGLFWWGEQVNFSSFLPTYTDFEPSLGGGNWIQVLKNPEPVLSAQCTVRTGAGSSHGKDNLRTL